jgi:hypothetical protein
MAFNMMFLSLVLVLQIFLIPTFYCQTNSPQNQNIETLYPIESQEQPKPTQPPKPQESSPPPSSSQAPIASPSSTKSSSNSKIVTAVAATATGTLILSALIFFFVMKCFRAKRRNVIVNNSNNNNNTSSLNHRNVVPQVKVIEKMEGKIKGLIVDEDGLDVVYWRKLEDQNSNKDLHKGVVLNSPKNKHYYDHHEENQGENLESNNQEIHLLRGKSSTSHMNIFPQESSYTIMKITPPAPPPIIPTQPFSLNLLPSSPKRLKPPSTSSFSSIPKHSNPFVLSIPNMTNDATPIISDDGKSQKPTPPPPPPPPPPPIPDRKSSAPMPAPAPPPPPILNRKSSATLPPPPPPPVTTGKSPAPPPPPKIGGLKLKSSSKPPPIPIETSSSEVKMKPLHWDKVNTNLDHSMVWDKIDRGSFR